MGDITDIERLNYYEGEYLGAVDFEAEQEYHRDMRRRHNIGPHSWGIVTGLEIAQFLNGGPNNEVDVYVQPGMAVDGFGREIVVFSPVQLTPDMFVDFPQKLSLSVWLAYNQQMIQPSPDVCATMGRSNAFSRVQEGFQIVIDPTPPTSDPVVVAGKPMSPPQPPFPSPPLPSAPGDIVLPPDDSVPYQALPDDNTTATWLIQLGQVQWDGPNQRFLQMDPGVANIGRQYIGSIAAVVAAPAGSLTLQDRSTPAPLPAGSAGVSAEVAGSLTVDRLLTAQADVWINAGHLYFKDAGGVDGDTPIWMQRVDGASGGADLHIHIGDNSDPKNKPQRLTVGYGPADGSSETNVFIVEADGNVDIPTGTLSFGTQQAQILNLSGTNYGIGVQTNTLYFRSGSDFAWYVNGTYSTNQDDPGAGGSLSMKLDSGGKLTLNGALVVDNANLNNANINPGLTFGLTSGEGIASKRTAGGNQYGLDFYTGFAVCMSITNSQTSGGRVGIGTTSPDAQLNLAGGSWDLTNTEGDLKIGNDTFRLKMGVALGGGGAGDCRIRAAGGTNRLMLGTGSNDVLTISGSNVGIGTTTPGGTLDVNGSLGAQSLGVSGTATIGGAFTVNGATSINGAMSVSGAMSVGGAMGISGGTSISGDLNVTGNMSVGGSKSGYLGERFISRGRKPLERGDVVVLHKPSMHFYGVDQKIPLAEVQPSQKANDTRVCGIVDEPVLDEKQLAGLDRAEVGNVTIGLMVTFGAYAHCKVDADVAPIEAGDLLTTSELRGYAQKLEAKAARPGAILGKALASLEKGQGMIPVLVLHQ